MEKSVAKISNLKRACFLAIDDSTHEMFDDKQFRAPEVVRSKQYDMKADIWSFGVIIFQLMANCLPFEAQTYQAFLGEANKMNAEELITKANPPYEVIRLRGYSANAVDLV